MRVKNDVVVVSNLGRVDIGHEEARGASLGLLERDRVVGVGGLVPMRSSELRKASMGEVAAV